MPVDYHLTNEINHLLSAWVLMMSFGLLYQRRLYGVLRIYLFQALGVALAAAWQGYVQDAPHLYFSALIIFIFKVLLLPYLLQRMVIKLGIDRTVETALGIGLTLLIGVALVVLALFLVLPVIEENIDFAFSRLSLTMALSVLFLGLLMMISRQNAILQVIGFLALENGLALGALGVKGMPLVVEMGIAIVVLVAFLIVGMFVFHIRDRFDDLDITYLANHRGETR